MHMWAVNQTQSAFSNQYLNDVLVFFFSRSAMLCNTFWVFQSQEMQGFL